MSSTSANAIRSARLALGLTQEQLGRRIGVKGRAIYRWERSAAMPTRRNRAALITAIQLLDPHVASRLESAFEKPLQEREADPPSVARPVASVEVELAVLRMADELDAAPRRIRASLLRLCQHLAHAGVTLDALREAMEKTIAAVHGSSVTIPS